MSDHETILSNMGSLEEYLTSNDRYGSAQVVVQQDGDSYRIARDADGVALIQQPGGGIVPTHSGVAAGQGQGIAAPAFTPVQPVPQPVQQPAMQPQGVPLQQYHAQVLRNQQLEEAALQLAQEKIKAEDDAFLARLEGLTEEEQQIALYKRYAEQLEAANQGLSGKLQGIEEADEEAAQTAAKWRVGARKAQAAGIPLTTDLRDVMMELPTPEAMDRFLARERQLRMRGQTQVQAQSPAPQQGRARQSDGRFAAGRGRGTTGAPAQTVKEGSGDLGGYIRGKNYQMI